MWWTIRRRPTGECVTRQMCHNNLFIGVVDRFNICWHRFFSQGLVWLRRSDQCAKSRRSRRYVLHFITDRMTVLYFVIIKILFCDLWLDFFVRSDNIREYLLYTNWIFKEKTQMFCLIYNVYYRNALSNN